VTLRAKCALVAVAVVCLGAGAAHGQLGQDQLQQSIDPAPAFTAEDLTALPASGWITNGGDLFNRRYSPLTQINRDNVADLQAVWRTRLNGSGVGTKYSGEAQPIVRDGVVYVATGANDVFAISVESGEILWTYSANLDETIDVICCGWANRGVGLGDGKVFIGQLDGKLVALDQQSGAVRWSVQAERWQEGFSITSAPLYYDGLVITGFAGAEFGIRGRVKAFDAETGSLAWTFYTIPGPGEVGHDTWPSTNDVWQHGGASVWHTPAVDPELGLLYFSTGNPGPDFNGAVRAGDNLFSASIVAVDSKTGEYRWHFQQVHHDLWDYDAPSPVVLFDIEIDGVMRKALAQPGKTGWVYVLDRESGEPLLGIEERPVPQEPRQATSPTQPFPVGDAFVPQSMSIAPEGYPLVNAGRIFTPFWTEPIVAKPGQGGGANWPASSYDPRTGYLYVCASDRTGIFRGGDKDLDVAPDGDPYLGGEFGTVPFGVTGIFAALDMRTNRLVWQQEWPERCYSGSVATAGGLVFVGRSDGRLTALDSSSGALLWEFQTGAGVNATVSTFEQAGQQYVVVLSAGNLFAGSQHGDSVWLFSLDGQIGPVAPPGQIAAASAAVSPVADLAVGRAVYQNACAACHGLSGEGGHGGGPALTAATNRSTVMQTVRDGRNGMPAFGRELSPEQIRDVTAHVVETLPH
jgi:quinohemoprotein ethanol dehydrogenase